MGKKQDERDYKRQRIIEKAVRAADEIIMDGSDGSEEETNYLTAIVAEELMKKAIHPFISKMLTKDIEEGL